MKGLGVDLLYRVVCARNGEGWELWSSLEVWMPHGVGFGRISEDAVSLLALSIKVGIG